MPAAAKLRMKGVADVARDAQCFPDHD